MNNKIKSLIEDVVEGYKKSGLKPKQSVYLSYDKENIDIESCCALTACCLKYDPLYKLILNNSIFEYISNRIYELHGLNRSEISSFIDGFDNAEPNTLFKHVPEYYSAGRSLALQLGLN